MSFRGYNHWKTTDTSQEGDCCPQCGGWLRGERRYGWECETCSWEDMPPDEPDYDAWAEDGP